MQGSTVVYSGVGWVRAGRMHRPAGRLIRPLRVRHPSQRNSPWTSERHDHGKPVLEECQQPLARLRRSFGHGAGGKPLACCRLKKILRTPPRDVPESEDLMQSGQYGSRTGRHRHNAPATPPHGRRKQSPPARPKHHRKSWRMLAVVLLCVSAACAVVPFEVFQGLSPENESAVAPTPAAEVRSPHAAGGSSAANVTTLTAVTADSRALISHERSMIRTVSKDGKGSLNLASAQLRRPPAGSLMAPLEVLVPSSPYGVRTSPITGAAGEFHWGQDYASPCGTRVYSADAGVVRAVGWHQWGGGNRIEIDHGNGLISTYNHLEAIAPRTGDSVDVGEVIARVGTTGSSTGCHLHFETIHHGAHTDPLAWTLLPIKQLDELGNIEMISYAPFEGDKTAGTGAPNWAIPATTGHSHPTEGEVTQQQQEPSPAIALPEPDTSSEPAAPAPAPAPAPATGTPATPQPTPEPSPATATSTATAPDPATTPHTGAGSPPAGDPSAEPTPP